MIGVMQLERSKNINSSAFSWAFSGRTLHSVGNTGEVVALVLNLRTVSWSAAVAAEDT